jgi:prephenate dehydrogenase
MGGSLLRDLGARGTAELRGWSPEPAERKAAAAAVDGLVAEPSWEAAVEGAELVVLAVPLSTTVELLPRVASRVSDAHLTDVASLKAPVQVAARRADLADRWVGSHPMAGSEGRGFDASRAGLYQAARVWTVAAPQAGAAARGVARLWRSVGAEPEDVAAEEHDRLMALASHLPQLTANALASVLLEAGVAATELGPGGADMTRLAGSSTRMWRDLLAQAPPELPAALRALSRALAEISGSLHSGAVDEVVARMERTARWKDGSSPVSPPPSGSAGAAP